MENQNQVRPPEDLAGYQHIVEGYIAIGDVIVDGPSRKKIFAESYGTICVIGLPVQCVFGDVYRKMACPKAGDHDKEWKAIPDYGNSSIFDSNHPSNKAKTSDEGKPPLAMLPWKALREVAQVQNAGFLKYKDFHNWKLGMETDRNLSCAIRHIADFMDGLDVDNESGQHNLAHAACRILFALENIQDCTATDRRYRKK